MAVGPADRQQVEPGSALPTHEEFGGFNQWPPNSCSIRRQQMAVGPADRQQMAVGPADRQQMAVGPADRQQVAVGPADRQQVAVGPADRQQVEPGPALPTHEEFGGFNQWPPNSCSVRRQQMAVGPADRQQVEPGTARLPGGRSCRWPPTGR